MVYYTMANRHVLTVWYVLLVNRRGQEYLVNYATDKLGVRNASIYTKRKHEVKGRAHLRIVSFTVRVAL